nr:peptidase M3 [Bacteroidota bacterium]
MLRNLLFTAITLIIMSACNNQSTKTSDDMNPFLSEYNTPFNVPPFEQIETTDFLPAIKAGIQLQQDEIEAIVENSDAPTFENTIEAFDYSGNLLREVNNVFGPLQSAHTSDELQKTAKEASPLLSGHRDDIMLNEKLFKRIEGVNDLKVNLDLTTEQKTLLEKTYKRFVRNGANLDDVSKEKLRAVNKELAMLSLQFDENLLAETNSFKLVIENETELAGLPQAVINSAAEVATKEGMEGKWIFTLHKPSMIPFLQYADNRALREKIFTAYIMRCDNGDQYDNKEIASRMAQLRT